MLERVTVKDGLMHRPINSYHLSFGKTVLVEFLGSLLSNEDQSKLYLARVYLYDEGLLVYAEGWCANAMASLHVNIWTNTEFKIFKNKGF